MMKPTHYRPTFILSLIILALMTVASAVGLFGPSTYNDNAVTSAALRGNDLVTLLVAVPLLAAALVRARQGNPMPLRWVLIWMAMLAYSLYNYVFYLYGSAINVCFIFYIALTTLSIWGLIVGMGGLEVERIASSFSERTPVRWIAGYMVFFSVFLGGLWVSKIVGFMVSGNIPVDITQTGRDTGIVYAVDLTLLIPTLLVCAVWLWQRKAWGLVMSSIIMLKCTAYSLALIGMSPFAKAAGMANAWELVPLWAGLGAGACACALALLLNVQEPQTSAIEQTEGV